MKMSVVFEVVFYDRVPLDCALARLNILDGHFEFDHVTRHPVPVCQRTDVLVFEFEIRKARIILKSYNRFVAEFLVVMEVQLASSNREVVLLVPVPELLQVGVVLNNDGIVRVLRPAVDNPQVLQEGERHKRRSSSHLEVAVDLLEATEALVESDRHSDA